jgi:hypothetical protein
VGWLIVVAILALAVMNGAEQRQMATRLRAVDPCRYWIPSRAARADMMVAWWVCWLPSSSVLGAVILTAAMAMNVLADVLAIVVLVIEHRRGDHDDDDPPKRRRVWRWRLHPRTGLPIPA